MSNNKYEGRPPEPPRKLPPAHPPLLVQHVRAVEAAAKVFFERSPYGIAASYTRKTWEDQEESLKDHWREQARIVIDTYRGAVEQTTDRFDHMPKIPEHAKMPVFHASDTPGAVSPREQRVAETPTADLAEIFSMIARRHPDVTALYDTPEFGERAARIYAALGSETTQECVSQTLDKAAREVALIVAKEREGEQITADILNMRLRSASGAVEQTEEDGTFGELPDEVRALYAREIGADGGHVWDNMTKAEQHTWLLAELASSQRNVRRQREALAKARTYSDGEIAIICTRLLPRDVPIGAMKFALKEPLMKPVRNDDDYEPPLGWRADPSDIGDGT